MNPQISEQMLLELKESADNGDISAQLYWDKMISEDNNKKIEGLIKNKDDLLVIKATPFLRNIYAWTAPFLGKEIYNAMKNRIDKIGTEQLKKYDEKSLKIEEEENENKKGSILFSHQRDQGLVYWCPNTVLNRKIDLPMGQAWPKNAKLIDTFDF